MVEKGRRFKPRVERNERFCFFCKDKIEDEIHFVTKCPLYNEERIKLYGSCRNNMREGINFDLNPTDEQKFVFIVSCKNAVITKSLAIFLINAFKLRNESLLDPVKSQF